MSNEQDKAGRWSFIIGVLGALCGLFYYFLQAVEWLEFSIPLPGGLMSALYEAMYIAIAIGVALGYWGLGGRYLQKIPNWVCVAKIVLLVELYGVGIIASIPYAGIVVGLVMVGLEIAAMVSIFRVAASLRFFYLAVAAWFAFAYVVGLIVGLLLHLELGIYGLNMLGYLVYAGLFGLNAYFALTGAKALTDEATPPPTPFDQPGGPGVGGSGGPGQGGGTPGQGGYGG